MSVEKSCLTIGVIMRQFEEDYQSAVWQGIYHYAKKHQINLVSIVALAINTGPLNSYMLFNDLIGIVDVKENLDGVIVMSGAMGEVFDSNKIKSIFADLSGIPTISISAEFEGVTSLLIDNREGIHQAVNHLVREHGCKRIAFVKGPEGHFEAEKRLEEYKAALVQNGIDVAEELIAPGLFMRESGMEAVKLFLDERKIQFDAILAVDDFTAVGAMLALQERGFNIPYDVAVIGFDDIEEAAFTAPPLTTIQQDMFKFGVQSIEMLSKSIRGEIIPKTVYLPANLVIRESCGCQSESVLNIHNIVKINDISQGNSIHLTEQYQQWLSEALLVFKSSGVKEEQAVKWLNQLIESLMKEFQTCSPDDIFLKTLDIMLLDYFRDGTCYNLWNNVLTKVRELYYITKHSYDINKLEFYFHKARVLICQAVNRNYAFKEMQKRFKLLVVRNISQNLMITYDLDKILCIFEDSLKQLEIPFCCITLYSTDEKSGYEDDNCIKHCNMLFAFEHQRMDLYPSNDVVCTNGLAHFIESLKSEQKDLIIMPLTFYDENLGFIVFGYNPSLEKSIYESLRAHISAALKGAVIFGRQNQVEIELKLALGKMEYLNSELVKLTIKDELTELYNRRGFFEMAQKYTRSRSPFVILFVDMDGLKRINDTMGHNEGDLAIKTTAMLLKQAFRPVDIIARLGGDEFIVLVNNTDKFSFIKVIDRLRKTFERYNLLNASRPYRLSISTGCAFFDPEENQSLEELMLTADGLLYEEKKRKKAAKNDIFDVSS